MTCHACGSRNPRNARICGTCGAVLTYVRKRQFEYETAVLDGTSTAEKPKIAGLSLASLILGLASLTPATFLTGVPAIITGVLALKRRRPGRKSALVGLVTGAVGTLILTFVMLLPLIAWQRDLHRMTVVKLRMKAYQAALNDYAAAYGGRYPKAGISWETEDDDGMVMHFKGSGQLLSPTGSLRSAADDELKLHYRDADRPLTGIPFNPYTRERYSDGKDFFYLPEYLADARLNAAVDRTDPRCPFVGLAAPGGVPGTIVIVGWSPPEQRGSPAEYAIVGFGRNTAEPLAVRRGRSFFVLHN